MSSVESWDGKLDINKFASYLEAQGKSKNTLEKYIRDMKVFKEYLIVSGVMVEEDEAVEITVKTIEEFYNFQFEEKNRKYASVNSYRSILRCYFNQFLDVNIKVPEVPKRQEEVIPLAKAEEALTYQEYLRLVRTAEKYEKKRIAMIIQAMAAIGLKVSELKYLTKDALRDRLVPVTRNHKKMYCPISESVAAGFEKYIEEENIKHDIILCTSKGTVVERANIWRELKLLCLLANVPQEKVSAEKLRETFELNFIQNKK